MSVREIHDQKGITREVPVQQAANARAEASAVSPQRGTTCPTRNKRKDTFESIPEDGLFKFVDTSLLPVARVDAANLIRAWQELAVIAVRRAPRIAFKVKGRILFLELAEIVALQAEGNYVVATPAQPLLAARVPLVHGRQAQASRLYSYPSLGCREHFGRGGDPTFTDWRVQAARKAGRNTWLRVHTKKVSEISLN